MSASPRNDAHSPRRETCAPHAVIVVEPNASFLIRCVSSGDHLGDRISFNYRSDRHVPPELADWTVCTLCYFVAASGRPLTLMRLTL